MKPHLDITAQIERLKEKGMLFHDEKQAQAFFQSFNYYRFAEYTFPFDLGSPDSSGEMRFPLTAFEDVLAIIEFDFQLRYLLFQELSKFETRLRTTLAYVGGELDPLFHVTGQGIRPEMFSLGEDDPKGHSFWLAKYNQIVKDLSIEDKSRNFNFENTMEIPIWGAVELMGLGALSKLYRLTDQRLSSKISEEFGCSPSLLKSWIASLNELRNHVAHHSRIWNRNYTWSPKTSSTLLPKELIHLRSLGEGKYGLYPRLAVLAWLNRENYFRGQFGSQIEEILGRLPKHEAISIDLLGFPKNWQSETLWRYK